MNRLTPLITRRVGRYGATPAYAVAQAEREADSSLLDDLKMFVTVWLGGLVFFATFIG